MRLGLLTAPFEELGLAEVAGWAAAVGYEQLEVAAWPAHGGERRRYAGTAHVPVEDMTTARGGEIVAELGEIGITISALGYYPNNLDPDPETRAVAQRHTMAVIKAAAMMGVDVVNTFIGADPRLSQDENYAMALVAFRPVVQAAEEHGIKLAIENCPMIFSADEWPSGKNVAYSPRIWRRMLEDFGPAIGLNLDPSHLLWQMIDVERVVREFGPRIWHVHVKDLQIDRDGLFDNGILSLGMGWQVPRLPGLGDVDWGAFISALYRVGYRGVLCVEHEDRDFEGSIDAVRDGFLLARNTVRRYLPR